MADDCGVDIRQRRVAEFRCAVAYGARPSRDGNGRQEDTTGVKLAAKRGRGSNLVSERARSRVYIIVRKRGYFRVRMTGRHSGGGGGGGGVHFRHLIPTFYLHRDASFRLCGRKQKKEKKRLQTFA